MFIVLMLKHKENAVVIRFPHARNIMASVNTGTTTDPNYIVMT